MEQLYQKILQAQSGAPRLFANTQTTCWGALYWNANNTLSADANHGAVWRPLDDYAPAFAQTEAFFRAQSIPPRLYVYAPPDREAAVAVAAAVRGGILTKSEKRLFVFDGQAPARPLSKLAVAAEPAFDPVLRETVLGDDWQLESILRRSLEHEGFRLYVGRLFGTPVAMASLWRTDGVARISNVMTGAAFRGLGFGETIMRCVLTEAAVVCPAYLFADNPTAIRLYQRVGMREEDPGFRLWMWQK